MRGWSKAGAFFLRCAVSLLSESSIVEFFTMNRLIFLCVVFSFSSAGCQQSQAVSPIDISQSGISITPIEHALLDEDWPSWRGRDHTGIARDQEIPTKWDAGFNIRWQSPIPGRGHSSPIVIRNVVYLASANNTEESQNVFAYDRTNGKLLWSKTVHQGGFPPAKQVHKKGTNANGTLASDGRNLYATFLNSGNILASAISLDGSEIWQQEVGGFTSKFGYAPSPILYGSSIIVAADNWGVGFIAALDAKTGKIIWRIIRGDTSSYSSPTIANVDGRDQLLISGCGAVTSYDPLTGKEYWRTPCIAEATCGTVVTDGTCIYASGGYPETETVCLSSTGEKIWSDSTKIYEPSMLVSEGSLFAASDNGVAYCWNAKTGDVCWRQRLGGNFSASPVLCNGLLYVSNLSGETFVFEATPDEYKLIAQNRIGDDCYASPAFSDGEIFLRVGTGSGENRQESLVCISEKKL